MATYRAPLPLAVSGYQDRIDEARRALDLYRIGSRAAEQRTLLDAGFRSGRNGEVSAAPGRNPYSALNSIQDRAASQSASQGFGFSGRMAQLMSDRPQYELRSRLLDQLSTFRQGRMDAANQYNTARAGAGRAAAAWGVQNEQWYSPRRQEVARYKQRNLSAMQGGI